MKLNNVDFETYFNNYPDKDGYFGRYGGVYVDDKLKAAMAEITQAYYTICQSRKFIAELRRIRKEFQGRPTPVTHLERLSNAMGGRVQLYAKREDLNHSGAHKLNHCMGEALLAKYMGKKKVIAETGAGQHGVALATAAAYFGLECDIYMGSVDIKKQAPNVARMKILGANHPIQNSHEKKTISSLMKRLETEKGFSLKEIACALVWNNDTFSMDWGNALSNDRDVVQFANDNTYQFKPSEKKTPKVFLNIYNDIRDKLGDAAAAEEEALDMQETLKEIVEADAYREQIVVAEEDEANKSAEKSLEIIPEQPVLENQIEL